MTVIPLTGSIVLPYIPNTQIMEILVFKTDVSSRNGINRIAPLLEGLGGVERWNLDLNDADFILRIEASGTTAALVEQRLRAAGHFCEELPD